MAPGGQANLGTVAGADVIARALGVRSVQVAPAFLAAPAGMAVSDMAGQYRAVNPALCLILGRSESQLLGHPSTEFTHPDDVDESNRTVAALQAGRLRSSSTRKRLLRPDGTVVPVLRTTSVLPDESGQPVGFLTQVIDLSDLVRSQEAVFRSESRYRALLAQAMELILQVDGRGMVSFASAPVERVLGYRPEEVVGHSPIEFLHPDEQERARAEMARNMTAEGSRTNLYRLRHKDGSWHHFEVTTTNLFGDPAVGSLVINAREVTEHLERQERLAGAVAQQAALAELGRVALTGSSPRPVIERALQLVKQVLGAELATYRSAKGDALGDDPGPGEDLGADPARRPLVLPVSGLTHLHGHLITFRPADGAFREDEVAFLHSIVNVIAGTVDLRLAGRLLLRRSLQDALTGLPNRALFVERLAEGLERRKGQPGHLSVLFIDTDDFKLINDSLGHAVGDLVVKVIAQRLQEAVRDEDTVARFGGDEFVVLCPDTGSQEAGLMAERLLERVSEPMEASGRSMVITASIGVATADHEAANSVEDLLANADAAMYVAKTSGKSRHVVFDSPMRARVTHRLEIVTELRQALEAQQLVLHYQPIVAAQTNELVGVEALVRWAHPERGLLVPSDFIGVAEDSGLIVPMGAQLLERAARQAVLWNGEGRSCRISVNLSPRQLADPDVIRLVSSVIESNELDPGRLVFEMTESAAVDDLETTAARLQQLRRLGCLVGMDDFGTGYSSLSLLSRLPVDFIKIDRSFVPAVAGGPALRLLEAIIGLGQTLGLRTVAEGVETAEQAAVLRDLGVDMMQGFWLGRPGPAPVRPEELLEPDFIRS
jgi:diguanylate cyclase (GGDEF)-like protein/PAS domain S-box-containing protein